MLQRHSNVQFRIKMISLRSLFTLVENTSLTALPSPTTGWAFYCPKTHLGLRLHNGKSSNDTTWRTNATYRTRTST